MNEDYMKGMACPQCGYDEKMLIEVRVVVVVDDDGPEDPINTEFTEPVWDEDSWAKCYKCRYEGTVGCFDKAAREEEQAREKARQDELAEGRRLLLEIAELGPEKAAQRLPELGNDGVALFIKGIESFVDPKTGVMATDAPEAVKNLACYFKRSLLT